MNSQYIAAFLNALEDKDLDKMNSILEDSPSIVEDPSIEQVLEIAYTELLRKNPLDSNILYHAVLKSNLTEKEKHLRRFETLDKCVDLISPNELGFD